MIDTTRGMQTHGLDEDFPILWDVSKQVDAKERLGQHIPPLENEINRALGQLWFARNAATPIAEAS